MSTYLVAYVVCDFQSVSGTTSSGVKVRLGANFIHITKSGDELLFLKLFLLSKYHAYFTNYI